MTTTVVKLALELNPMQSKIVQEAFKHIHTKQHSHRDAEPHDKQEVEHNARKEGVFYAHGHASDYSFGEENQGELLVRQGQCPETQVRCRVRHGAQNILDGLDNLVDDNFVELERAVAVAVVLLAAVLLIVHDAILLLLRNFRLVLEVQDDRLWDEQERDSAYREQHQCGLQRGRAIPKGRNIRLVHGHANQRVDDARWSVHLMSPLVED